MQAFFVSAHGGLVGELLATKQLFYTLNLKSKLPANGL